MSQGLRMDDAPMNTFHVRVCCYTTGGYFCDGYILGSIGLVLPLIAGPMGLGAAWQGLLGASALIGIFLGALIFGPITDRIGRQKILIADLVVFVLASIAQIFVDDAVSLLVLRLILGLAMGADYAIGPALLCEFVPKKRRGNMLATLNMVWTIGFVAAYGAGFVIQQFAGADAWRVMLGSSAIPAFLTLLLRLGTPESPRWLMSRGRVAEARKIVKAYIGKDYEPDEADAAATPVRYAELFNRRYRSRTIFAGAFWLCQVFPYFAIGTFLPSITKALGLGEGLTGEVLYNVLLALGALVGFLIMDTVPRRLFVIATFAIVGIALVVLGLAPGGPLALVLPVFLILAFVISAAADLESVYPAEVFPTEVRASGVGLAAATSRAGAALSTFVLPMVMAGSGVGVTMLLLAAVVGIGLVMSIFMAPETRHLTLTEAAKSGPRRPATSKGVPQ